MHLPLPRRLVSPSLAALLLIACGDDKDPLDSAGTTATAAATATATNPGTMTAPATDSMSGTSDETGGTGTMTEATGGMTGMTGTTGGMTGTTGAPTTSGTTGEMCVNPDDPASVMSEFGAPCVADADCVTVLGEGGVCLEDILRLYGLPCGFCSKLCDLPPGVGYVEDDMSCGPGVTCIGADGYFEACVVECTDNSQCPRDGYECRLMPEIGQPTDPKFCLMTDDNMF